MDPPKEEVLDHTLRPPLESDRGDTATALHLTALVSC